MTKDRIWFNTIQAAFILNTTDRTIRTRAKNHLKDSEMVVLKGKAYELSDLFISLYRKLSEVIGSDDVEEDNEVIKELKQEIDQIMEYLPEQLSEEEVTVVVQETVGELGATTIKDMGKVMAELKAKYAGQIDMGKAGAVIKQKLSA